MRSDEKPIDIISDEVRALGAVCDLLHLGWRPNPAERGMQLVDSYNLFILLERIQRNISKAAETIIDDEIAKLRRN